MRVVVRVAFPLWVGVVLGVALAACRGGVKSGLAARLPEVPPAVAAAPAGPGPAAPVTPVVYRIEYYKISDG